MEEKFVDKLRIITIENNVVNNKYYKLMDINEFDLDSLVDMEL